jgi:hypothetical protein
MDTKYYNNLFIINDINRKKKYHELILLSLKNDMNKWTVVNIDNITKYISPNYNNSTFIKEVRKEKLDNINNS